MVTLCPEEMTLRGRRQTYIYDYFVVFTSESVVLYIKKTDQELKGDKVHHSRWTGLVKNLQSINQSINQ